MYCKLYSNIKSTSIPLFYFSTSSVKQNEKLRKHFRGSSQDWLTRHLKDPYVKKAQKEQYRARSAFKLIEINEKYNLLRPGQLVVECGAAPGAWSQVAVNVINSNKKDENVPVGKLVAVDILPFSPVDGAIMMPLCDFTDAKTPHLIKSYLDEQKVDLVLSDMAPNASGTKDHDHECIVDLAYYAFKFAIQNSNQGSSFLCKIWNGYKLKQFVSELNEFYKTVRVVKPDSSRKESSEIFILAQELLKK